MYELPSSSWRRAFSPLAMKTGSPPTPRKARTGEFTPPGNSDFARSNSRRDFSSFREGMAGRLYPACRARGLVSRSSPLRVTAIPHGGHVVRAHGASALQAPLGALERELDGVGRVVPRERRRVRLDGAFVVAQFRHAVALLEEGLGGFLRVVELALDSIVGGDGVGVAAGEVIGGGGEERGGCRERGLGPAALELGGGGAGVVELALLEQRTGDPQLGHIGALPARRRRYLIPPGLEGALHVADAHVEVAEPLPRLECFGSRWIPLHQLPVLDGGAARVIEVDGAEIARQLQRAAADGVDLLALLVAQSQQNRPRLEQCRLVVSGEGEISRMLQTGCGPPAGREQQRSHRDRDRAPHDSMRYHRPPLAATRHS